MDYFMKVEGLILYAPVFEDYLWEGLRQFREDNVQYLEIRGLLPKVGRHLHVCVCRRACVCMYVCLYACMLMCVHVCICVCIYGLHTGSERLQRNMKRELFTFCRSRRGLAVWLQQNLHSECIRFRGEPGRKPLCELFITRTYSKSSCVTSSRSAQYKNSRVDKNLY